MAWNINHELARFGPSSPRVSRGLGFSRMVCARVARQSSENFPAISLLLPRRLLPHFQAVYAFCRWSDDLADEAGSSDKALSLLTWWREELLACEQGKAWHPVMVALLETNKHFGIPYENYHRLINAFERDQHQKQYATFADLISYSQDSANPVGRIVLHLYGHTGEQRFAYSDDICTGLQLANFWQDVARDSAIGRRYLPQEDLHRFGYSTEDFANKRFTPAFAELMKFQVERTQEFFERGRALVKLLPPPRCWDVAMFAQGGEEVLKAITAQGYNVWAQRPRITKMTKAKMLLNVLWSHLTANRKA